MAHAMELGHPAYDRFYLALAAARQMQLVTADAHFVGKAQAFGNGASVAHLEDWHA
jgi:predicted nucleic acid-binding protein